MNVRIQAKTGYDATQLLIDGCKQLQSVCKHIDETYTNALNEYYSNNKQTTNNNNNDNNNNNQDDGNDIDISTSKKNFKPENDEDDSDDSDIDVK